MKSRAITLNTLNEKARKDNPVQNQPLSSDSAQPPLLVAIVGGGPRGLWATERLLHHAVTAGIDVEVTVFDPQPLGYGAAYDITQPDSWRLNVTPASISTGLGAFNQWRTEHGHDLSDPLPPRNLVGRFLADSWAELVARFPAGFRFQHQRQKVTGITPAEGGWQVSTQLHRGREFDEVLVATGHADSWPDALPAATAGVPTRRVYPAQELSDLSPGATVLVRGASLSFLDAALTLTVERGGDFLRTTTGLVYLPSGREPSEIIPFSRSGRFMVVKPGPGEPLSGLDLTSATRAGDAALRLAENTAEIRQILSDTARSYLRTAHARVPGQEVFDAILAGTDATGDPVAELRHSVAVAEGSSSPDAQWAIGEAWRRLYPAIIWRTSFGGRSDLPGFHELSRRLERVAFGPPLRTSAELLALIDAGVVDTRLLTSPPEDAAAAVASAQPDVVIDAVLAPQGVVPGTLAAGLVEDGLAQVEPTGRGLAVARDGTVCGQRRLAVVGRDTEDTVLGNDSLNRGLHDVIERWARRVSATRLPSTLPDPGVAADPPLTARLEPWEQRLVSDPARSRELIGRYGSPVNVLDPGPMERNIAELVAAGRDEGVRVKVFFARKANKALGFVDRVRDLGHGVDVASYRELSQVLDRGVSPHRIILSAAIKPDRLLEVAVRSGVCVSVDSVPELHRLGAIAQDLGRSVRCAPRLASDPQTLPPTRFGELLQVWETALSDLPGQVELVGVHVHLHGYSAADRRLALAEALTLVDAAVAAGHRPEFIDLGGGVPMSYLDSEDQWQDFLAARQEMNDGEREPFTWKADPLATFYPFHQHPTRGGWLRELLSGLLPGTAETAAAGLIRRGLALHLEPGRSILDGCGMILAEVSFIKQRSDGLPLIGVAMNRTQCLTTSADILLDPVLVRSAGPAESAEPVSGFLVGAYCIEDEVIIRRRLNFPGGVRPGDVIAIPNTAGYFMHILESASHQIPLARNVMVTDPVTLDAVEDDIDGAGLRRPWAEPAAPPGTDYP